VFNQFILRDRSCVPAGVHTSDDRLKWAGAVHHCYNRLLRIWDYICLLSLPTLRATINCMNKPVVLGQLVTAWPAEYFIFFIPKSLMIKQLQFLYLSTDRPVCFDDEEICQRIYQFAWKFIISQRLNSVALKPLQKLLQDAHAGEHSTGALT